MGSCLLAEIALPTNPDDFTISTQIYPFIIVQMIQFVRSRMPPIATGDHPKDERRKDAKTNRHAD
jgi:hypothetical protein